MPTKRGQSTIRVLVADDHPPIVEGLSSVLTRFDVQVIGQVNDPDAVPAAYAKLQPDVLVLDVRFGDGAPSGLDAAQQTLHRHPSARIVVYSQFDQDELIREVYRIGCAGFVVKRKPTSVLADAIRIVHGGKTFFLDEVAQRLALIAVCGGDSPLAQLLPQELEVFKRMALGLTNVEIADALKVSPKTVSTRSQTVKDKLGIHRAAEITRLAVRHGVIEP